MRIIFLLLLLGLVSCTPATSPQQFPENCIADTAVTQLLEENWLAQEAVWRLRQVTLLEVRNKKVPLEGFLRLDLVRREAHLIAMNEIGVVLFDLFVTEKDQQLKRAIPQLQQMKGLAVGVAQSLRIIFLQPRPQVDDQLETGGYTQQLQRVIPGGNLSFVYDCRGDLRTTRLEGDASNWRVAYDDYRQFGTTRLPKQIIMNDYRHRVKLSLWIREARQEL